METAAKNFLNSLTPEQRAKAAYKFGDDQRFDWHFTPKPRKGLPLKEMTSYQSKLAHGLLAAGLSQRGYIKAVTIMSLEDVLNTMEKDNGEKRNPDGYFFTVFGDPTSNGVWGFRVEGHHVSQTYTVVAGKVVDSPSFFGSNPAEIKDGPRKGMRVLAGEEDLARDLVTSLDDGQKKIAVVDQTAYKDIFTMASPKTALAGQPSRPPASKLNTKLFAMFM